MKLSVQFKYKGGRVQHTHLIFKEFYQDEYTLEELSMGHVRLAMQEEIEYFCDKVWVMVPLTEAQSDPDGKIIGSRWLSCNKHDINDPDVRCRLVGQEAATHADESFYAATTPIEAKRFLFPQWSTEQRRN